MIFYSWSSNWGSEFQGGVRISLPDPASITVIQGYEQNPNGTLRVDYPDVARPIKAAYVQWSRCNW